ncbi:MAG: tRNA (cytidine(34)-2'-O)-methyltransferase [Chlamydiales bacterium]|nr:tRNA (cytidine(34)-2'-O)-methyltransferase [Chlamydiales bacterium]
MQIILFEPQIPQNTGNVVRTCKVTGSDLILINPGFDTSDRMLKRAGLDYWDGVNVSVKDNLRPILEGHRGPLHFFTSKATQLYTSVSYQNDSILIFGSETKGLPDWVHQDYEKELVKLPMVENVRCLNLATSVGIGLYEALRQTNFTGRHQQNA